MLTKTFIRRDGTGRRHHQLGNLSLNVGKWRAREGDVGAAQNSVVAWRFWNSASGKVTRMAVAYHSCRRG
ncbi:hypothetical protein HGG76_07605 [Ochrobactrum tritici]|uniref:Uncharacterized protein n=1 Tax=Brucella tritici TaxID=94626 RepID=A0A7X6FPH9_9HYPH|nr:hypothetical protein [Brucella tritici]NKW09581.1 hypothetical protein [Brucella tritici]